MPALISRSQTLFGNACLDALHRTIMIFHRSNLEHKVYTNNEQTGNLSTAN